VPIFLKDRIRGELRKASSVPFHGRLDADRPTGGHSMTETVDPGSGPGSERSTPTGKGDVMAVLRCATSWFSRT